ncbi:MAG: smalltalk protein [Bacteroides sp.]|nr:smalltalk protein [Bacteroides sp.]
MKQETRIIWGKILNIVITVLTAIATTFGVSSCMRL